MNSTLLMGARTAQRGAATIVVAIVLLIAATLIVLTAARTTVTEQRLSANDVRARQALAAAQAGIDHAIALRRPTMPPGVLNLTQTWGSDATLGNTAGIPSYRVRFCPPTADIPACPATPANLTCGGAGDPTGNVGDLLIYACGWSDDLSARRPVTLVSSRLASFGAGVGLPLVAQGSANLLVGGASIINYFNDLTVWSGDSFLGQSMTGKTFIRDINDASHVTPNPTFDFRDTGNSPSCNNPPDGYICSTQGSDVGHDVIVSDTNLSSLSSDDFFSSFMGSTVEDFRDVISTVNAESADAASLDGITGESIWVEGDISLGGTYGTPDAPVVLVVNGDLSLGANAVINGIVYVAGALNGNGTPKIFGSLIVAGTANATGNLSLIFDPNVLGKAANLGMPVGNPTSWKDWLND